MRKENLENYHELSIEYKKEVVRKVVGHLRWESSVDENGNVYFSQKIQGKAISRQMLMEDYPIIDMENEEVIKHIKKGVYDGWMRIRKKRVKRDEYVFSAEENTSGKDRYGLLLYREDGKLKLEIVKQQGKKSVAHAK